MKHAHDTLPFAPEIAAMSREEFFDAFNAAYNRRDRETFILLGQRLAWIVTCNTIRAQRLASHRLDMYSAGLVGLIEQFDRTDRRDLDPPYAYFRQVAYYQILGYLYKQGILLRKGAKRPFIHCDSDVTRVNWDGPSVVESAPGPDCAAELSVTEAIEFCLQAVADAHGGGQSGSHVPPRRPPMPRRGMTAQFNPLVTETPAQLKERGYTWRAIAQLLGISLTAA